MLVSMRQSKRLISLLLITITKTNMYKNYINSPKTEFEHHFRSAGYIMDSVFLAGHSLGGVVLESYISNHMKDNIMGLILFGSYLPDLPSTNNTFPVPVLSAVGTLDGLTLSIGFRYISHEFLYLQ